MIAIDMHAHVPRNPNLPEVEEEEYLKRYFKANDVPKDSHDMASKYKKWDMLAVIFSVDTQTSTGDAPDGNEYVADIAKKYPEQFIGFATIDPWMGNAAVLEIERSVSLGLKGLKLHPIHQAFHPNDSRFYPIYQKCSALEIPVLFHTGYAAVGTGMPGGGGFKLKYAAHIPANDDIAADFPSLTIIIAHPAWPWIDQQIAVALHKPNVFLDLSGWAPKFIPEALIRETNTRLKDKVMFGSDFPYLSPDRWLREFELLDIRDNVRPKVLLENAKRVLKLSD